MIDGKAVKAAREAADYTQETLAIATGLSRRTIQNVENGLPPSAETIRSIRAVLDIGPSEAKGTPEDRVVEQLMAYWIGEASPETEFRKATNILKVGLCLIAGGFLGFAVLLLFLGKDNAASLMAVAPVVLGGFVIGEAARRHGKLLTESDIDGQRASYRERLKQDGLDEWRIPDGVEA